MAKPSKINPSFKFSFKIHPASKLKHAIAALSDPEFNERGTGLIEVGHHGLEITARNTETDVVGYLRLNSTGLVNFHCEIPVKNMMIDLDFVYRKLVDADDEDTISVRNIDGSNELCFVFGSAPAREFAVELLEMDEEFVKFPDITYACEAVVLSEHLNEIMQQLVEATLSEIVSFEITDKALNISVGKGSWRYDYDMKKGGTRGMAPGQQHHAWFLWPHRESLKKASFVALGSLLCLVTNPSNTIMWRFNLRELGDLVFISEATMIITNSNELPVGLGHLASVVSEYSENI